MDYRTTSVARPSSRRGSSWFGKGAFAVAALVVTSGLAAWIAEFDPTAWLRQKQANNSVRISSFDDRFGSGSVRNGPSIRYPSRPVIRSARRDFDAEFGHIENQLADLAPDPQTGQPAPPSSEPAIPLPRSRPAEANLALRIDPPPPARTDDRTMFQKLADLVPMRFTLASLTPSDGLFSERPNLGALGYDDFHRRLRHLGARGLHAERRKARGAFGAWAA